MIIKDYYKILGFKTNKVSVDEIKVAYREMAKKYHPDVNGNNTQAENRFKDIVEAYNTLTNNRERRKYDRKWQYYIGKKINKMHNIEMQKQKIFGDYFSERKKPKKKKKEIEKHQ